jgi:hypothetical protein
MPARSLAQVSPLRPYQNQRHTNPHHEEERIGHPYQQRHQYSVAWLSPFKVIDLM